MMSKGTEKGPSPVEQALALMRQRSSDLLRSAELLDRTLDRYDQEFDDDRRNGK